MPTYKNTGNEVVDVGGLRIEPGETVTSLEWFKELPSTVTKVSDSPFYDPIIYSASITAGGTHNIEDNVVGNYKITVYCATGNITVKLNSSSGVAKVLGAGETYIVTCLSRIVDSVILAVTSGTGTLTVERI